ncbi:hypothetical protein EC973_005474 [Apophysomyces ossiformis]|uniref:Uncharacterized protein n=1 Tax=Apophysomyces ossiformis TaxID=679940 RepID=A0A8H7ESV4_9FUNG|nr:hypothetical protein EC973_005474 [Apophysomyces ossiformis]
MRFTAAEINIALDKQEYIKSMKANAENIFYLNAVPNDSEIMKDIMEEETMLQRGKTDEDIIAALEKEKNASSTSSTAEEDAAEEQVIEKVPLSLETKSLKTDLHKLQDELRHILRQKQMMLTVQVLNKIINQCFSFFTFHCNIRQLYPY